MGSDHKPILRHRRPASRDSITTLQHRRAAGRSDDRFAKVDAHSCTQCHCFCNVAGDEGEIASPHCLESQLPVNIAKLFGDFATLFVELVMLFVELARQHSAPAKPICKLAF
jgi:hypothetical protein